MRFLNRPSDAINTIPIDRSFLLSHGAGETVRKIRSIVRNVEFELLENELGFRMLGPDMYYHTIDPYLSKALGKYKKGMLLGDILDYRSRRASFDLCFEDSWSGYFLADHLGRNDRADDLVLIHLDDHTDMMSTLLERTGEGLTDPSTGKSFDPSVRNDWESAIYSGCIGIGSFITPLYYSDHKVHVRHLNNSASSTYDLYNVIQENYCYELIPNKQFAAIRLANSDWQNSAGTYRGGNNVDKVLASTPEGQVIVHIDLDYFINDFNGNVGTAFHFPNHDLKYQVIQKLERFFDALHAMQVRVDHWIIATSPGFCSAYHWDWLLTEIEDRIK
ncbi:hypothetical protein Q9L42_015375 [Methylomarinum sp. Ch1-1]|uniref:Uncharacterized protein n=1 Tax=Methylomarinum roseum TaxID=3067653 RepID=A0AAU7NS15_9GAMM|nr:hypothetical protein [Methylomarinum sp. Ch1-1]MDP4520289.1 hypothetical protein [Methylomarinum sp. Ch1-1]